MEGPSLVILREEAAKFTGRPVLGASGDARIDFDRIAGKTLRRLDSWGKHFLMVFDDCYIRIHYLMFGSAYIDRPHYNPEKVPKLALQFANGYWNNYNCAVKINEGIDIDSVYDFGIDLMNDRWDGARARKTLRAQPDRLVCDALLDQQIFSGLGNIMKNETLFRTRIHPESRVGALPPKKLTELVQEARTYAFDFLRWKKEGALKKHWEAHTKKVCPRCHIPLVKQHTGVTPRRSFFCTNCQVRYE